MIKNFDEIKRQLKELSAVVNAFKSEAVQLRLVELVFGAASEEPVARHDVEPTGTRRRRKPAKLPKRVKGENHPATAPKGGRSSRPRARLGGKSTLKKLYDSGFFKKVRTINDIVKHADTNLATKLKQSDLSGPLARYVRDEKLKRAKNKDNQYEYLEA